MNLNMIASACARLACPADSAAAARRFFLGFLGLALAVAVLATPTTSYWPADRPEINYYGRWSRGCPAITVNSGSLMEFVYSGDHCELLFDVAGMTYFPAVFVQVDNGPVVRTVLSADINSVVVRPAYNTLPAGAPPYAEVSTRFHFVRCWIATHSLHRTEAAGTQWTTLNGACKFRGLALAGELRRVPYAKRQIEFLGDSFIQGLRLLFTGKTDDIGQQLPYVNWPQLTADLLGLKPIATGFGGQAMSGPGTAGAPAANEAFPFVCAGIPWQPRVEPEAVVIYQGINGGASPAEFERLYATYLEAIRRAYPTALVFAVCPHKRAKYAEPIRRAVEAQKDRRMRFLDFSTDVITPAEMCDPIGHLNPGGAVLLATRLAGEVAADLDRAREQGHP